ncbi:hypothetical protein ACP4OV_021219 [Aristida adscensionis]
MGNSLPLPCVCHDAATAGDKKKRKRKKKPACRSSVARASARHVVPVVDMAAEDGDGDGDGEEEEEGVKEAWPAGWRVEPAGSGGEGGGARFRIVVRRKDAAELVARLEQRAAAERKARMEELNADLGGDGAGAGGAMMSPCRDAWRPRLASIPEGS